MVTLTSLQFPLLYIYCETLLSVSVFEEMNIETNVTCGQVVFMPSFWSWALSCFCLHIKGGLGGGIAPSLRSLGCWTFCSVLGHQVSGLGDIPGDGASRLLYTLEEPS